MYSEVIKVCIAELGSDRGFSQAKVSAAVFELLLAAEPSIADQGAFRTCELGLFALRGLSEKVRRDAHKLVTPPSTLQSDLFGDLDYRYAIPYGDGGERYIETAKMLRDEWVAAEEFLFRKSEEVRHKAVELRRQRLEFDWIWAHHPELTSEEAFRKALARESGDLAASGSEDARLIEQETV